MRLLSCLLCASLAANAQDAATIRTNVPLVLLPVTVTDGDGKVIDGLVAEDFAVSDEGVRQTIRMDTSDSVLSPISLVVIVQTSSIAAAALSKVQKVGSMIRPVIAGDRGQVAILAYDREIRELTPFTADEDAVARSFERLRPRSPKQGVLLDAVVKGIQMLQERPENNRRVILFFGESRDRGSVAQLKEVVEMAQRANVAIYPATYSPQKIAWTAKPGDAPPPPGGADILGGFGELARFGKADAADTLARNTGGHQMAFSVQSRLEEILSTTGTELHSQYLISFAPLETVGNRYRRVQVKVPKHPKAVIRARPGYWP